MQDSHSSLGASPRELRLLIATTPLYDSLSTRFIQSRIRNARDKPCMETSNSCCIAVSFPTYHILLIVVWLLQPTSARFPKWKWLVFVSLYAFNLFFSSISFSRFTRNIIMQFCHDCVQWIDGPSSHSYPASQMACPQPLAETRVCLDCGFLLRTNSQLVRCDSCFI
jgi:hypothetical protein